MIDTVKVYHKLERLLDHESFSHQRIRVDDQHGKVVYHWRQVGEVRITWRQPMHEPGYIYAEFSVARMTTKDRRANLGDADVLDVIDRAAKALRLCGDDLPHLRWWKVSRIDYAWNFHAPPVSSYLALIGRLHLPGYSRHHYDPGEGIVFKNASGSRWVKFYDKDARLGDGLDTGTLRMEVSLKGYAVRRLAHHTFGADEALLYQYVHEGRALYVLAVYMHKLGLLSAAPYAAHDTLHDRVRERYGSAANTALGALSLLREHGRDVLLHDLMSQSSYYHWRKRLAADGFLTETEEPLPSLRLPLRHFAETAQDVEFQPAAAPQSPKKYLDFLEALFGITNWNLPKGIFNEPA